MNDVYTLAYSPCPNDTFIFAALTNGLLADVPRVHVHLADIEELNAAAQQATYELTKVSYGAIPYLTQRYRILRAGGALGRGCGPLVVARPGRFRSLGDLRDARIAIPGERTTAFLLLQLALGARPPVSVVRFDRIIDAVASGEVDAGLIIHESRFTYREKGLVAVADLGAWWEEQTELPIPLGAILVRDDLDDQRASDVNAAIRTSLQFAYDNDASVLPYIRAHAFEMSDDVMRQHIALYVNAFTDDLGDEGIDAVGALFERARHAGIITTDATPSFSPN